MQKFGEAFKGKLEYAYHRTSETNIPSIVKNGFIPGYGDMYGKGWYMCYDLESQLNPNMVSYGKGVIKTQIFDKGVLIFDYNISKEMYGSKYTLVDQLLRQGIFTNINAIPKFYKDMSAMCEKTFDDPRQSAVVAYNCFVRGQDPIQYFSGKRPKEYNWGEGTSCLNVKGVPKINKITAIVFSGNHDGNVIVGYSPNTVLPVAYAIIDPQVCYDFKAGKIKIDDIEFTPLTDYEIAEERARQARELYERLGTLRNSSIISLNLQYGKMTSSEFETNFKWIARDSKVTNAEITVDKDKKFIFTGGSWDNGVWQGDVFGVNDGRSYENQPVFKGGIFTSGEFFGDWEFGKFINGTFNGRWRGKGSKMMGGIWSAPPSCWGPNATLYYGSKIMYETKPGSGKFVESDLTPPDFYKSLEGPEVKFSDDRKVLEKFDSKFAGIYTVPDGVNEIADGAFRGCKLKGVIIPNSVNRIGVQAFEQCKNLSKVQLGNGLKSIHGYAFAECASLSQITLPTGLQDIFDYVFQGSGLTSIVVPDSVKYFGTHVFSFCSNLSSAKLPSSIIEVPEATFDSCTRLFKVEIHDSCLMIGDGAFNKCSKLRLIKLPSRLREIKFRAFLESGLTELEIPSLVNHIYGSAFTNCKIKTLKMSPISTIDYTAFLYCDIDTIIFDGTLAQFEDQRFNHALEIGVKVKCKDGEMTT